MQTHLAVAGTDEGSDGGSCAICPPAFVSGLQAKNGILDLLTSPTTATALLGVIVNAGLRVHRNSSAIGSATLFPGSILFKTILDLPRPS